VLSEPQAEASPWTGRSGFVHEAALADLGADLTKYDVYASGPPAMVEAIRHTFVERGLPRAQLYFDSFDYAPDTLAAMRKADDK
jgi:CDP-4-dehydro-6-deoxyglucose reductase